MEGTIRKSIIAQLNIPMVFTLPTGNYVSAKRKRAGAYDPAQWKHASAVGSQAVLRILLFVVRIMAHWHRCRKILGRVIMTCCGT